MQTPSPVLASLRRGVNSLGKMGLFTPVECVIERGGRPHKFKAWQSADSATPAYVQGARLSPFVRSYRVDAAEAGITEDDLRKADEIIINGKPYEPQSPAPDAGSTGAWLRFGAQEKRAKTR